MKENQRRILVLVQLQFYQFKFMTRPCLVQQPECEDILTLMIHTDPADPPSTEAAA